MNKKALHILIQALIVLIVATGFKAGSDSKPRNSTAPVQATGSITVNQHSDLPRTGVNITYTMSPNWTGVIYAWNVDKNMKATGAIDHNVNASGLLNIVSPAEPGRFTYRLVRQDTLELIAESNVIEYKEFTAIITVAPELPRIDDLPVFKVGESMAVDIWKSSGFEGSRVYLFNEDTQTEVAGVGWQQNSPSGGYSKKVPETTGKYTFKITRGLSEQVIGTSNVFTVVPADTQNPTTKPATTPTPTPVPPSEIQPPQPSTDISIVLQIGNKLMTVNGANREIDPGNGTAPVVVGGRTLLPVRAIIDAIGGKIDWDGTEQKVTITANGKIIVLWIGKNTTTVNGVSKATDAAPTVIKGRTMLPGRFIAENLGYTVNWNEANQQVTITGK